MKKTFYTAIAVCGVLTAVLWVLAWRFGGELLITLLTTAATTFYHLLMRLVIGFAVHYTFPKQVNPQNRWFREQMVIKLKIARTPSPVQGLGVRVLYISSVDTYIFL